MKYIGENIKRIRLAKGINQSKIIELAKLSRVGYINIEKGESIPNTSTLINIANALDTNINEILSEPIKLNSLRYRVNKIKDTKEKSKMLQDEIKLAKWLADYTFLEVLLNEKMSYLFEDLIDNNPITAAYRVREILKLSENEPIYDIISLLESAGIKVYLYKSQLKQSCGMSLNAKDGAYVVAVNIKDNYHIERQLFTAAHELGHLILHNDSYNINENIENENEEAEANSFASHFLMPNNLFNQKILETKGKHWIDRILHVKAFFKVSYKTVLRRLIDNNLADNSIYQRFNIDFKKLYQHDLKDHFEPFAIREKLTYSENDYPALRFNRLVKAAFDRDLITFSKAADMLDISIEDFKELSQNWGDF